MIITEANVQVRWQTLVVAFNMSSLSGFEPWDAQAVDNLRGLSSGEEHAVSFLLGVWDPGNRDWQHARFDAIEALAAWDEERREAFVSWAMEPFWP